MQGKINDLGKEDGIIALSDEMTPDNFATLHMCSTTYNEIDIDYLTLLEDLFVKNLNRAEGSSIVAMVSSHSDWARDFLKLNNMSKYQ